MSQALTRQMLRMASRFTPWSIPSRVEHLRFETMSKLVLVVDVGGGTTDLTLIQVEASSEGPVLRRLAVSDHLMLGGDNMDAALAVKGVSPEYLKALRSGALKITYAPGGEPIEMRVARHIDAFKKVVSAYNQMSNEPIILANLPEYADILKNGAGAYLSPNAPGKQ
jgi:hypothetical protein